MTTTPTSGAADLPEARLFTKKPVTIAAIQWTGKNLREVIAFTDSSPDTRTTHAGMAWEAYTDLVARDGLKIYTLEGTMLASPGDWIILGVKGEYYPCKPDIFEATYSPAALAAGQATAAQGVAYADAHGAIMGAAYDFRDAHISGGPNQKRSAHAALESAVTHALRASHGQAPAQPAPASPTTQPAPASQGDALDAERLDWLEADERNRVFHLGKSWYTRASYGSPHRKRASLREAIDAARAAQEGKSHDN